MTGLYRADVFNFITYVLHIALKSEEPFGKQSFCIVYALGAHL